MLIIETLPLLRQQIRRLRMEGKRVALVPTMGNLHDGHMKLVDERQARADVVVVSIFVNPMQFDRPEDLARYPRTLQEDCEKLNKRKVDLVFAPSVKEIYPNGTETHTYVDVPGLSTMLEGASRPGHFRGVSTIVSKLFNLVQPDIACFGEKDFQQLALIRKMVADMGFDIEIIGVPIMRAKDGLALSSRNGYLTADMVGATSDEIVTAFATGQVAMILSGSWNLNTIDTINPDMNYKMYGCSRHGKNLLLRRC